MDLLQWYFSVIRLTRDMRRKAFTAFEALTNSESEKATLIKEYLSANYATLSDSWIEGKNVPSNLGRHIHFGEINDYRDMLMNDISEVESAAERELLADMSSSKKEAVYPNDVFVSYSSQDQKQADNIYDAIIKAGGKVFLSGKSLNPGDDFAEKIRNQLINSRELWLLVTPNSLKSEWVLTEWGAAWLTKKKIIPIIYRCKPEDLPDRLKRIQCTDFSDYPELVRKTFSDV
jgi:hypothetical protein